MDNTPPVHPHLRLLASALRLIGGVSTILTPLSLNTAEIYNDPWNGRALDGIIVARILSHGYRDRLRIGDGQLLPVSANHASLAA